jgi:hypothetical protein
MSPKKQKDLNTVIDIVIFTAIVLSLQLIFKSEPISGLVGAAVGYCFTPVFRLLFSKEIKND